ncbi:MAG TPA: P-II family nitrogen regulator [Candidatus Binataceae bacterium]|nr:P-II family nitrogen regulator [Candidatus Binataceae bacterium]
MKKIEAVLMPHKLDDVRAAMIELDLEQFVVGELTAHEPEDAVQGRWGNKWHTDFRPRLRLEVVVDDEIATTAAQAILRAARTRYPNEASVTIATVEEVVEIVAEPPMTELTHRHVSAHA